MKKEVKATTKKQPNQYTVSNDGKAWISQREVERVLGLSSGTITKHLKTKSAAKCSYNTNEFNQLDAKTLHSVSTYYARKNDKALDFALALGEAGARAYIYGMAGQLPEQQNVLPFPTNEANKLIEGQRTAITSNRATNIKKRSDTLKYWVFLGWLRCELKYVKQYKYSITPLGLEHLKRVNTTFFLKDES